MSPKKNYIKKILERKYFFSFIFSVCSFFISCPFFCGAEMSSDNYKINADVVGQGGILGSSNNFNLTDTIGEPIIGIGQSDNYKSKAGFWQMVSAKISLLVDSNTVALGTINPGTPVLGESSLTVSTDAWGGYELFVSQNHSLLHTDASTTIAEFACSMDSPCLWSGTGLGFSVKSGTNRDLKWGSDPNYKYAYFPNTATKFHETLQYISGDDETGIGYKVDVSATQKSGDYSNIVIYTAMMKL